MSPAVDRRLILVKHSLPEILRDTPAAEWRLSDEGRSRCAALAARLRDYSPWLIVSSVEPKAAETAAIVARELGLKAAQATGLEEHDRRGVGWLDRGELCAAVRGFFEHPGELVMGRETADQAHARFAAAVEAVARDAPGASPVIVAHGTVISLLVSRACGVEPFALWKSLGLPSFVVLDLPGYHLREIVGDISPSRRSS